MRRTELRGRAQELELLLQAAEAARAGSGTTVLLEGEAGIGKTRLIDEIAGRAEGLGMRVYRGAAEELEQARPFGSLIDALGSPDTAPRIEQDAGLAAEQTRYLVQDAFVDHVEHLATSPLLLAFDDLQWGDRATMATLWLLARRSRDMGLLLVLAFRPTPEAPGLERVVEGCERIGALHLDLGPIPDAALSDLALDVLGAPPDAELREQLDGSGGNPFVAIELLASLSSDRSPVTLDDGADVAGSPLPPALRGALLRRFTGLSETTRRALPVAAVLGSARVDDLAALLGVSSAEAAEAVAEACAAGLFEPAGDVVAFRHDLIREALYEDVPEPARIGWHREAARRLDGRAEPAVVAYHLLLGASRGDADAVDGLRRAAETMRHAPDAAAELLARAIELTDDRAAVAELATERAVVLRAAGRVEAAAEQAAAVLAGGVASPELRARAHLARARACSSRGRLGEALADYESARATGGLDELTAARALGEQAVLRAISLAYDQAIQESDAALAQGRAVGHTGAVIDALIARALVHSTRLEHEAAIASGHEALALAAADPEGARGVPSYLALTLMSADRLDEAWDVAVAGRRQATEVGDVTAIPLYQTALAIIGWCSGRWDEALAAVDEMTTLAEDFGVRIADAGRRSIRGLIALHRGDVEAARAGLVADPAVSGAAGEAVGADFLVLLQALLLEHDGEAQRASTRLLRLYEFERALGLDIGRIVMGPQCVRLALAAGDQSAASDVGADVAELAARAETPSGRGAAAYARGALDEDGADALTQAAAEFAAAGRPLDRLFALEAAAKAASASGHRDVAEASARAALEVAEGLGAVRDGRRITALLRDLGVRIGIKGQRARPTHGWEALTNAERDVAELVGERFRNREIADRLFISRRTVETHVSRLYQKLGTKTRLELAKVIREHRQRATSASPGC